MVNNKSHHFFQKGGIKLPILKDFVKKNIPIVVPIMKVKIDASGPTGIPVIKFDPENSDINKAVRPSDSNPRMSPYWIKFQTR